MDHHSALSHYAVALALAPLLSPFASAQEVSTAPTPAYAATSVTYPDGAIAEARPECAVLDLCATITLPDQDVMRIYNKGAGRCEPYVLHLVRTHGDAVLLDSELVTATTKSLATYTEQNATPAPVATKGPRFEIKDNSPCPRFANSYFNFDAGRIRMGVFQAKDGALFVQFSPPK